MKTPRFSPADLVKAASVAVFAAALTLLSAKAAFADFYSSPKAYFENFTTDCNSCTPLVMIPTWSSGDNRGRPWVVGVTKLTDCGNTNWSVVDTSSDTSGGDHRISIQMYQPEVNFCSTFDLLDQVWDSYAVTWRLVWSHE